MQRSLTIFVLSSLCLLLLVIFISRLLQKVMPKHKVVEASILAKCFKAMVVVVPSVSF
jgi:hypothetical protein